MALFATPRPGAGSAVLRAAGPATGNASGAGWCPASNGQSKRRARTVLLVRDAPAMCSDQPCARAPRALETRRESSHRRGLDRGVGEGRTGLESSVQSRVILNVGRDPGAPSTDALRALDRPGVHHGCTVPVRAVRPSCTQTHRGARQRMRDRAAGLGK